MRPHLSASQTPAVSAKQQKKVRVGVQGARASQPSRTLDQCRQVAFQPSSSPRGYLLCKTGELQPDLDRGAFCCGISEEAGSEAEGRGGDALVSSKQVPVTGCLTRD